MEIKYTKLDKYNYDIVSVEMDYIDIIIEIDGSNDIIIADISSELTSSEGYIYVEGRYYKLETMYVIDKQLHILTSPLKIGGIVNGI